MNKKLQKGIVAAIAATMGTGLVAPVYAAAAGTTDLAAKYAAAYQATVSAKTQKELTAARVLVDALYAEVKGTADEYLATTLSSILDPLQQKNLVALDLAIKAAEAAPTQAKVNEARALLVDMPTVWAKAFSSYVDGIQDKVSAKVVDAIKKAQASGLQTDLDTAKTLYNELLTVTNNAGVKSWAETALKAELDKVVVGIQVVSVDTLNATQVLVTFNQEVDETDAETLARYQLGAYTFTASLRDDKKSVLLTTATPITGTNLYIVNPVKSAADATKKTAIFTKVETYTDVVSPVVTKVEYPTYDVAKVTFSEPVKALGNVTITQDGSTLSITPTWNAAKTQASFSLASAAVDKAINVVIVGAKDMADNLVNPNPVFLTFTKVKADTTKPAVSAVNVLSDVRVSITFSEKLKAAPSVTVGGNTVVFDADSTSDNITWVGTFAQATGIKSVVVAGTYQDMSGNVGDAYSVLKQLSADTTAPTLVSSSVKVFDGVPYLVLTYSEDVTSVGGVITGTTVKDYVSTAFGSGTVTPVAYTEANGADADNAKAVMVDISSDTVFPLGAYTVSIPAGFVKDKAFNPNSSEAASVTFTKGTVTVNDTTAPTVNAVPAVSTNNKTMTVSFSESMDYATALNVANYKVGGASIFTKAIFDGNDKTVTLTFAPGTITYAGDRLVTVSGVKDKAGNANTAYSHIVTFKENVAPYVASAKLTTDKTIEVTYSEAVNSVAVGDFEVYVAGTKVTATTAAGADSKTVVITLGTALTDLSKTVQVKLVNAGVTDVNGNPAVTGQLVTVQ